MKKILLFLSLMAFTVVKSQDVCTGLISMYTFNNTLANQYNTDPFDGANTFYGGAGEIYIYTANNLTRTANIAALPVGNSHRTIAMRVQPSGNLSGTPTIFKYGSNAVSQMFGVYYSVSTGTLTFQGFGSGNDLDVPNFNVAQDTWFNLVLTYDGSNLKIYVNGSLKTQAVLALNTGTAIPFTLGGNGTIYHDNLRIYNRALSAADVAQLDADMEFACNNISGDICTGLVTSYSFDYVNSNDNGTESFTGGVLYPTGVAGEGVSSSGITANISNLPVGNSARTVACWFKQPSGIGYVGLFSYGTANNGEKFGAYVNLANGDLYFQGHGGLYDELINNTKVLMNTWHHIAVAYTGTVVQVYFDGSLREQFARNLTTGTGQPFTLGNGYNCVFDDLKIFDRVLSSDDVFELYNKPQYLCNIASSGVCQNLLTSYSFNNTSSNQDNTEDFVPTTGGTPTFTTGIANSAMNCVSGTSYTTSISTLPLGNSARTVSLWMNPNLSSGQPNIFNYGSSNGGSKFGLYFNTANGILSFQGFGLTHDQEINNTNISSNTWHHLALVYTGKFVQVYVNGVLKESFQRPLNTTANNMLFTLGGFNGLVDDLRIYNRALSEDDVAAIYADPETGCTPTAINNLSANENLMLQIYPNPANDVITINYDGLKETNSSIEIINTVGQTLIKQDVANETSQNINVSNLTSGIYFVQIKQNGKSIATKKLVINK